MCRPKRSGDLAVNAGQKFSCVGVLEMMPFQGSKARNVCSENESGLAEEFCREAHFEKLILKPGWLSHLQAAFPTICRDFYGLEITLLSFLDGHHCFLKLGFDDDCDA